VIEKTLGLCSESLALRLKRRANGLEFNFLIKTAISGDQSGYSVTFEEEKEHVNSFMFYRQG
jgi:hypothetical protein